MTLLLVYEVWFWLCFVGAIALVSAVAADSGFMAALVILASVILLQLVAEVDVWGHITEDPLRAIGYLGVYFLVGVVWALVKWVNLVYKAREAYRERRSAFLKSKDLSGDTIPEGLKPAWVKECQYRMELVPQVSRYQDDLLFWIAYWPASLAWMFVSDALRWISTRVYTLVRDSFQAIANRLFPDADRDGITRD